MTIEAATTPISSWPISTCALSGACASDVVVMDNLSSHKVQGVCERIKSAAAELPICPYSPDLNPIEKAWSKLNRCSAQPRRAAVKNSIMQSEMPFRNYPGQRRSWFKTCHNWVQLV